jgi:aspartyl aminopeptidase
MAVFKCLISGNTVEFHAEHDVKAMQDHSGYEEVKEENKPKKKKIFKTDED